LFAPAASPSIFTGIAGETEERWMRLCEQAAKEQDSAKLHELILEIDRLLNEKRARLKQTDNEIKMRKIRSDEN
jgi:hypothetical protein